MSLKRKINKDAYAKLSDDLKSAYEEKDGSYVLTVEGDAGDDDTGELRRANDRLKQEAKEAKAELKKAQEKLEETTGIDAKKRGDIETLEASWKEKLDKVTKEKDEIIAKKDGFIRKTLVDSKAHEAAAALCGDKANLILPHIKARLTADLDGDEPTTKVLDAAGKLSALTMDDLKKEFIADKDFAAIIVGSKASGSGTPKAGEQKGQGGAPLNDSGKPVSFKDMTPQAKQEYLDQKKAVNT